MDREINLESRKYYDKEKSRIIAMLQHFEVESEQFVGTLLYSVGKPEHLEVGGNHPETAGFYIFIP